MSKRNIVIITLLGLTLISVISALVINANILIMQVRIQISKEEILKRQLPMCNVGAEKNSDCGGCKLNCRLGRSMKPNKIARLG
jgi:hypothetical protein